MRRRPLMSDIVMTINLVLIFLGCYLLFYIIGGAIQNKLFDILGNIIANTENSYYYLYFGIKSIINYGVIILAIIFSVKYTFKLFVCYQDDGEKVFKYSMIGISVLLLYNNYTMYNNMLDKLKVFTGEKIFAGTEALEKIWINLQGNLKIVFVVINIIISIGIIVWAYKNKKKMIDKCDFRI